MPDMPILSPEQDLFSLSAFARRLARTIRAAQSRPTTVIGLSGAWGSGKTSVINLALLWLMAMEKAGLDRFAGAAKDENEALDALLSDTGPGDRSGVLPELEATWGIAASGGSTIILRYDPWLVSGHETLVSDFFRLLGERVFEVTGGETGSAVRAAAFQYAEFMDMTQIASSGVGRLLASYSGQSDSTAPAWPAKQGQPGLFKGRFRRDAAGEAPTTLAQARERLNAALHRLRAGGTHILAVIDHVDRLPPAEVRQVLSMLKTSGDLTRLTYLLPGDRSRITEALGEDGARRSGSPSFLEKIVQIDLDMPQIADERLLDRLMAQSEEIFGLALDDSERADLQDTFEGVRGLLQAPRDTARLANALAFADAATGRAIRTTDLIRLEMIRLKEPAVHEWLMRNAQKFHPRSTSTDPGLGEEALALCSPATRDAVAAALARTLGVDVGTARSTPSRERLHALDTRAALRSREGWEAYLQSSPDADIMTREEWTHAGDVSGDLIKARAYVKTLAARSRSDGKTLILSLLEGLDRLTPPTGVEPIGLIGALLELPDDIVSDGFGLTHRSGLRALHHLLDACQEPGQVLSWLAVKEGVNPFAVIVVLEYYAEQLGLMATGKSRSRAMFGSDELIDAIGTVYLRIAMLPAERVARWFATVDLHRLLSLGMERKDLLQFARKILSKAPDELRYFLQDVCSNWSSPDGVVLVLARRPDPDLYPLEDMRNYALRMMRKHPDDDFFADFVTAADEFLENPGLKDRTARIKAQFERLAQQ